MSGFRLGALALVLAASASMHAAARPTLSEGGPTPPGITTRATDTDGVVYVDAHGRTLYTSPADKAGQSNCNDARYTKATHTISGITYYLPAADVRPTCSQVWPPLLATGDAKPVGDWTIAPRADGSKQWAFKDQPVYRFVLDEAPGDVNGVADGPGNNNGNRPITKELGLPPGITTRLTKWGRALAPMEGSGILYVREDAKADCDSLCRSAWRPLIAPAMAEPHGDLTIVATGRGFNQWAFKGKPLFAAIRLHDDIHRPPEEAPGWRPAIYRPLPAIPSDLTTQLTAAGLAYADKNGHTVYFFNCIDETIDRQFCDILGTTPITRLTMFGGPEKFMRTWRPVVASPGAKSSSRTWTVVKVDKTTGGRIPDSRTDGLSVWAYWGRPLYTYYMDKDPGDAYGDGIENLSSFQAEMINLEFHTIYTELR